MLDDVRLNQFRTLGYTTVPQLFDGREIAAMRAELERLKRDGAFRNVATDGDGKTHSATRQNHQICPLNPHSSLFRALGFCDKVVAHVQQLIGEPVLLHLDQVFVKPAKSGAGTSWHQDNGYFKCPDPTAGTAMWIAVHDATVANGTMHVIPGVFRERYEHSRDPMSDHHIRCYPDEAQAQPIELAAGGVLFFCYGVPHCTRANTTDRERAGVALHFVNAAYRHELEGSRIQAAVTGPDASGGEREYGIRVAGTWNDEVELALARDQRAGSRDSTNAAPTLNSTTAP